jgi:hypothetical protein
LKELDHIIKTYDLLALINNMNLDDQTTFKTIADCVHTEHHRKYWDFQGLNVYDFENNCFDMTINKFNQAMIKLEEFYILFYQKN